MSNKNQLTVQEMVDILGGASLSAMFNWRDEVVEEELPVDLLYKEWEDRDNKE